MIRRMPRRLHFAAPFVLVACSSKDPPKQQEPPPSQRVDAGRAIAKPTPVDAAPAAAPAAHAWAPHPDHPELLVPDPRSTTTSSGDSIVLEDDLTCMRYAHVQCDPGDKCNPPPPEPVRCPSEIRPRVAPGQRGPTSDGKWCHWNKIEVTCPAGALEVGKNVALPAVLHVGNGDTYLHELELACYFDESDPCPPDVDCNPPPPRKVPCPPALLPTLINGAKPNWSDGDHCFWDEVEVACP